MTDSRWYQDAVIYELHVRAFFDSNDDGIGDFRGIIRKLDYIQDLGVNTIWLLPFYPSPGKDDGYDIADYRRINPQYGTREDFRQFVDEAHRRGLRVITELVINHTSDQHPWFQAARRAAPGSRKRNYYVWSDDPNRYAGTRIIFTDTESSNWALDPVARSHYWHRFFSHQPDLNFDNPHVERAISRVMRFWLDQGVDGLRLDAIPYLVEREGTSNENLRETHEVVKRLRRVIDERYTGRLLLGEANMWPEDVRDYFGDGDECHMAYHFPLMPRMYMAIAQEDRHPIVEIMEQTPDIPAGCQWAIFLRNHDELTLEMVTSRERDYMYRMYAADPRARLNLGIRRRLAPLMENDPERIKLMNSLLLSMPGSPIIYYGDEIGMGDNVYLGDRNGVRTPMQWSPDRNAGFSRADPQQLYLPPVMDPVYGYEAVNVEAQHRDSSSLLNWMKRMLQVRKTSQAFGRGALRFIRPGNRKVLVYLREYGEDVILCVANLARSAQPVELDLSAHKGAVPIELLGRTPFPPIGDLPYFLTLPGYGFYWFRLSRDARPPAWHEDLLPREELPVLVLIDGWKSLFPERVAPWRSTAASKLRAELEERTLPRFVAAQRWYGGKGSAISRVGLREQGELIGAAGQWLIGLFDVENETGKAPYFLPLSIVYEGADELRWGKVQASAIARVRQQSTVGVLADASMDESFCRALIDAIGAGGELPLEHGTLRFSATPAYAGLRGDPAVSLTTSPPHNQGSNTTLRVGEHLFLKLYRHLQDGVNPELEIGRALSLVANPPGVAALAGAVEYHGNDGRTHTLALLQAYVPNQGDGWNYTLDYLVRFLEDRRTSRPLQEDAHGAWLALMHVLAERTAQLHAALTFATQEPAFASEPITPADLEQWRLGTRRELDETLELLAAFADTLPEGARADAEALQRHREQLGKQIDASTSAGINGLKTRIHGDYHLGQVLLKRNDFVIVDFEGEPARALAERRARQSPLRDVASLFRSFTYAREIAQQRCASESTEDCARWAPLLVAWETETRRVFLEVYDRKARAHGFYATLDAALPLLGLFEIGKALYELRYELRNRPQWAVIALRSLVSFALPSRGQSPQPEA